MNYQTQNFIAVQTPTKGLYDIKTSGAVQKIHARGVTLTVAKEYITRQERRLECIKNL